MDYQSIIFCRNKISLLFLLWLFSISLFFFGCDEAQQKSSVSDPYGEYPKGGTVVRSKRYGNLYGEGLLKSKTPPWYRDNQDYYDYVAFLLDTSIWLGDYKDNAKKELKRLNQGLLHGGKLDMEMTALNVAMINANGDVFARSQYLHELSGIINTMPDTFAAKTPLVEYVFYLSGNSKDLIDTIRHDPQTAMLSNNRVTQDSLRHLRENMRRSYRNSDIVPSSMNTADIQIYIDPLMRDMLACYTTVQIADKFLSENFTEGIIVSQTTMNSLSGFTQSNQEAALPMKAIQLGLLIWMAQNETEKASLKSQLISLKTQSLHRMGSESQSLKSIGENLPGSLYNYEIFKASEKLRKRPENLKLVGGQTTETGSVVQ